MSALLAGLVLLAFYLIPLGLLWWGVRWLRRRRNERAEAAARAVAQAAAAARKTEEAGQPVPAPEPRGMGYSFPLGVPLVVCPLLLYGMSQGSGRWWSYVLHFAYLGMAGTFTWMATSRKEFESIRDKSDPTLNRETWMINWLLFFVILPMLAWAACGAPPLVRGLR